ncbi:MAG TPA: S1C family serine protease [Burkholderiales bacterium]
MTQLSANLSARAAALQAAVAAIRVARGRHVSGIVWQGGVVVTSEQSLPERGEFDLVMPGGAEITARLAGRDAGTNIALLRLEQPGPPPALAPGEAQAGALALALGADGAGAVSARLGLVNLAGPQWHSLAGGLIERRIALDLRLARAEEGGPVFGAAGAFLGMSTLGARARVLVIPAATLERIVPLLSKDGRVARGWLGVALHPVAVPDALREQAGQASGLMVMSLVEGGPAAKAGVVAGDIVLSVNDAAASGFRRIAGQFAADSIGRKAALRVIRSGNVLSLDAVIEARPHA